MIPLSDMRVVAGALVVIFLVGVAVGGPASLASDVGLSDEDVCEDVALYGADGVRRLERARFPHATDAPLEVYRLSALGEAQAIIEVDWEGDSARCLPLDYAGPVSADFQMDANAYTLLVRELREVLETGTVPDNPLGNYWVIVQGTSIGGDARAGYTWTLAWWASGLVPELEEDAG